MLIANLVSISDLYLLHISFWFGSVLDTRLNETDEQLLQNREGSVLQLGTHFKTGWRLSQIEQIVQVCFTDQNFK